MLAFIFFISPYTFLLSRVLEWVRYFMRCFCDSVLGDKFHMTMKASEITGRSTVCSTDCPSKKLPKPFIIGPWVRGIHLVDSPHKGPLMHKSIPCHDVIILHLSAVACLNPAVSNSVLSLNKPFYRKGDAVTVTCKTGYQLPNAVAANTITCGTTGAWNGSPTCTSE